VVVRECKKRKKFGEEVVGSLFEELYKRKRLGNRSYWRLLDGIGWNGWSWNWSWSFARKLCHSLLKHLWGRSFEFVNLFAILEEQKRGY
jgi:hypothetical protein